MGFDLYGIKPQENTEKPEILNQSFIDVAEDIQEEFWIAQDEYEHQNPGVYFRLNVWTWRPVWTFVYGSCDDILTQKDYDSGQFNDGHRISKTKATRIAKRLQKLDKLGILEAYECEVKGYVKTAKQENKKLEVSEKYGDKYNWASEYPFYRDHVVEFALFCEQSGGFTIC